MIRAEVVADSISETDVRITTFLLTFPRFILAELLTHRVFSRNTASSRAIPVKKMLNSIVMTPVIPIHWGKNQKGMQAREELIGWRLFLAKLIWNTHRRLSVACVRALDGLGLHKQLANRLTEAHAHVTVLVTSTQWENFFHLRLHPDAMPEFMELARQIKKWHTEHKPKLLTGSQWHMPFVDAIDLEDTFITVDPRTVVEKLRLVSIARCARTSYTLFEASKRSCADDYDLGRRIINNDPIHASPLEHQATPDPYMKAPNLWGNFHGWIQNRKLYANEAITEVPQSPHMPTGNGKDGIQLY